MEITDLVRLSTFTAELPIAIAFLLTAFKWKETEKCEFCIIYSLLSYNKKRNNGQWSPDNSELRGDE